MDNSVGNIIRTIGKVIIGLGLIAAIVVWVAVADEISGFIGFISAVGTFVSTFISGILFVGFSEIIFLLEDIKNGNRNKSDTETKEQLSTFSSLIVNKKSQSKQSFECANCGKSIQEYPCRECGFNFN